MKKILISAVLLLTIIYSCGPTTESQAKMWTDNIAQLTELKSKHPAFSNLIESQIAEATKIFDSASSIADEKAKAQKLKEANNFLLSGCVGNLMSYKTKIDALKEKKNQLKALRGNLSESDVNYVEIVLKDMDKSIKKAKKVLDQSNSSEQELCNDFEDAYKDLVYAEEDIDRAIKNLNEKISAKKDTLKSNNSKTDVNTTNAPADIKCEYCGTVNPGTNEKCSSCGAPLKK